MIGKTTGKVVRLPIVKEGKNGKFQYFSMVENKTNLFVTVFIWNEAKFINVVEGQETTIEGVLAFDASVENGVVKSFIKLNIN